HRQISGLRFIACDGVQNGLSTVHFFNLFFLYHALKLSFGGSGRSRCLPQTLRLLYTKLSGVTIKALRAILPKKSYKEGLLKVAPAIFIAIFFVLSGGPCLAITCRHLYSCSWILIFTGHTLVHEPQSVEAKGRELCLFKSNPGERMEPIGPGTVD